MTDGFYRCDRCETFERGPQQNRRGSIDFSDEQYRNISYGYRYGDDKKGSKSKHIDLCENCRRELDQWIKNGGDGA